MKKLSIVNKIPDATTSTRTTFSMIPCSRRVRKLFNCPFCLVSFCWVSFFRMSWRPKPSFSTGLSGEEDYKWLSKIRLFRGIPHRPTDPERNLQNWNDLYKKESLVSLFSLLFSSLYDFSLSVYFSVCVREPNLFFYTLLFSLSFFSVSHLNYTSIISHSLFFF